MRELLTGDLMNIAVQMKDKLVAIPLEKRPRYKSGGREVVFNYIGECIIHLYEINARRIIHPSAHLVWEELANECTMEEAWQVGKKVKPVKLPSSLGSNIIQGSQLI